MANLLETSEIKRETVDNLISDQNNVIHQNRSFILECPDCKKKFHRMILFLQHREVHKKNRKLLRSENKKKRRKRRLLDRLTNNAASNNEKHTEKLKCNNDITNNEVVGPEHEKNVSLECETQPRQEIKIEVKDEFECSEYTLTPFTHYGVHIEKDFVEEEESKHKDKNEHAKRKLHQVKDNAFQCEICDRTFAWRCRLTEHLRIHTGEKPFECKICFSRYRIEVSLINHSVRVHANDKPFQCKICSSSFKIKAALIRHSITRHPENNPYKGETLECDVCQKKFFYKSEIFRHKRVHTGEKPFNCSVCQKGHWKKLDLVKHLKSHTGDKKDFIDDSEYPSFKCGICSKTFTRKNFLNQHKIVHTDDRPFQCKICPLRFKTKAVLVKHTYRQHLHKGKQTFECEICSKTFTGKGDLKRHQRVHTDDRPLFQCKICSLKFKTNPALVKHSYSQHPEDHPYKRKTFECDVCQKKFPYKTEFFSHKRIHTGEKPFNCAVCQKGYWNKLDLVEHLKSHAGDKKDFIDDSEYPSFTCEICSKTFMRKGKLNRHLRSHTDDRPFQCKICPLKFKTKPGLVQHRYRQHPEDNPYDCKKDYRCDVCQKKFLYKSDMVYHRKKHTGDKHLESHSGKEKEKYENLVLERCSEENARLQCEAPTKEEIKIEVNEEVECSEYTLQPFTYHGLHIEDNGVEEYESKHKYNDVHEERKHQVVDQVREDVTDSESRDHCYVEEKLEKHKFNEPYLEVVDIKEDTDSENYTS